MSRAAMRLRHVERWQTAADGCSDITTVSPLNTTWQTPDLKTAAPVDHVESPADCRSDSPRTGKRRGRTGDAGDQPGSRPARTSQRRGVCGRTSGREAHRGGGRARRSRYGQKVSLHIVQRGAAEETAHGTAGRPGACAVTDAGLGHAAGLASDAAR